MMKLIGLLLGALVGVLVGMFPPAAPLVLTPLICLGAYELQQIEPRPLVAFGTMGWGSAMALTCLVRLFL